MRGKPELRKRGGIEQTERRATGRNKALKDQQKQLTAGQQKVVAKKRAIDVAMARFG